MSDDDRNITWEEFKRELDELPDWISKRPRPKRAWLYAVERWAQGDR